MELSETGELTSSDVAAALEVAGIDHAERADRAQGADLGRPQLVAPFVQKDAFAGVGAREVEAAREDVANIVRLLARREVPTTATTVRWLAAVAEACPAMS
jgi:hypothetical protein